MISRCLLRADLVAVAMIHMSARVRKQFWDPGKDKLNVHIVLEGSLDRQTQVVSLRF